VESAAGRKVKCRRCGNAIKLAGAEPVATPTVDLRAMADLERKGQILAPTPEQEFQQYRSTVAELTKPQQETKKKDYRSIHDLASTPDAKKKLKLEDKKKRKPPKTGLAGMIDTATVIITYILLAAAAIMSVVAFKFADMFVFAAIFLWILTIIGYLWMCVVAFMDHWGHGLAVTLLPIYALYYGINNWDNGAKSPFLLLLASRIMGYMLGFAAVTHAMTGDDTDVPDKPGHVQVDEK